MQELNSILIEGRLMIRPDHRMEDGRLIAELVHGDAAFPVAIKPGRLADFVEKLDNGRTVRMVGRIIGWPLITGGMIEAEHVEVRPSAVARALARADVNGAD